MEQPPYRLSLSAQQDACLNCGMERAKWSDGGYARGGKKFCCQGCGENRGCTCSGGRLSRLTDD